MDKGLPDSLKEQFKGKANISNAEANCSPVLIILLPSHYCVVAVVFLKEPQSSTGITRYQSFLSQQHLRHDREPLWLQHNKPAS